MADADLLAVRRRIAAINQRFPRGVGDIHGERLVADGVVPFEVRGEAVSVVIDGGMPRDVTPDRPDAEWAIVVDDWALVVPAGNPRALGSLGGCGLRIGTELLPLPTRFEADRYLPQYFPETIPNALLHLGNEQHGTPVGSVYFSILFRDGVPEYAGDQIEFAPGTPHIAAGYSWPIYWAYRHREVTQHRLTTGAFIDGHFKHLFTLHGLLDHDGFFRNVAEYPPLPPLLLDYCQVLAHSARQP